MTEKQKAYAAARAPLKSHIPYIKAAYGYKCAFCGNTPEKDDDLEVHHIIPLADGGHDIFENVVCLCHDCHWKAHNGEIDWFDLFKLSKTEIQVFLAWSLLCDSWDLDSVGQKLESEEGLNTKKQIKDYLMGNKKYASGAHECYFPRGYDH